MDMQGFREDRFSLIFEFLKVRGLVKEHLHSYNHFINYELGKIVQGREIRSTVDPEIYLSFKEVKIGEPSIMNDGIPQHLFPQSCRLTGKTYGAPITTHLEYVCTFKGEKKKFKKNVVIGRIPVMLKSCCCVLSERDETELTKLGECPLDPGGYFIVKGDEKLILMQEQLSNNRIFTDIDKKGNFIASVTSSTASLRSTTIMVLEKEKIYVELCQFQEKLPVMVVMKAMGIESDQEVVQMIGGDDECYISLLLPSIEECAGYKVNTQKEALQFLEDKVRQPQYPSALQKMENRAFTILRDVFIAHIPVHNNNFHNKCAYAALMSRRLLEAFLEEKLDDKDHIGNKRFELSGQLLSFLFKALFDHMITEVRKKVDKTLSEACQSRQFDFSKHIRADIISFGLEKALSTGNWAVKGFMMERKGMTQVLDRTSFIQVMASLTRIQSGFEKSRKVTGPRAEKCGKVTGPRNLHLTQFGMLCPCDTPIGESCGLIKHLALTAHVTTVEEEGPLISLCSTLGVEDLQLLPGVPLHSPRSYLVTLNGIILGKHSMPQRFANDIRRLRRSGRIGKFVSVFVDENQHYVYIASDEGRVCRSLIIVDKGGSMVKQNHMQLLVIGVWTLNDFLRNGLIEYLDVNEQNNALIAQDDQHATLETTHIEIEPLTILGVCAGLIPFPHNNHTLRNIYQCAMGKQAMGNIAYNQLFRMDSLLRVLVYPQRPLLTTKTIELIQYDKLGAGQNATVAVMSYTGYDTENAIVMNKSSLDRGFGHCIVMMKEGAICRGYENEALAKLIPLYGEKSSTGNMQALDDDGIASPAELIRKGDFLVDKNISSIINRALPDRRNTLKHRGLGLAGETSVVDRVALFSDENNNMCVNLVTCQTRRPEVGDRYGSRHGHKGVCGAIVQQEDFAFSERGICPDLIMNPHAFMSATIGALKEILGSKAGASCGTFQYGTAFGESSGLADLIEDMSETLVNHGFSYKGKDFLYSGTSGVPLAAYIYMGPMYYQKLKHMVSDKMQAHGRCQRGILTRQPAEGVRLGERERDCLISYGASSLLYERLMVSSDKWEVQVCRECGLMAYYNHRLKVGVCRACGRGNNVSTLSLPYATKLLIQELQAMNIVPRFKLGDSA